MRENYRLFEPDELTPEERLERVIELLTEASLDLAREEENGNATFSGTVVANGSAKKA